jgi:hypothetical protein
MGMLVLHRVRRGGAPPEQDSTASRMDPQRLGWWHRAGDGCTIPTAIEGTCSADCNTPCFCSVVFCANDPFNTSSNHP